MSGFSPKFPLQFNESAGAYVNNTTLKEVIKQNFKNLLLTNPGERVMNAKFGVGLRRYFFEPMTNTVQSDISAKISSKTSKYMPFVTINDIGFNSDGTNDNLLAITISYSIIPLREVDTMVIAKDSPTIEKEKSRWLKIQAKK